MGSPVKGIESPLVGRTTFAHCVVGHSMNKVTTHSIPQWSLPCILTCHPTNKGVLQTDTFSKNGLVVWFHVTLGSQDSRRPVAGASQELCCQHVAEECRLLWASNCLMLRGSSDGATLPSFMSGMGQVGPNLKSDLQKEQTHVLKGTLLFSDVVCVCVHSCTYN